jgi:hypothetical protein
MKLDYLKEKKELLPGVLLVASAFLAVLALIKVTAFFVASARAENIVKRAVEQSNTDDKSTEEYFAESTKLADELKKNNLFAPPPPKQHPVKEVWGIFGDQVLIKDKWYDVGDKVGDAKIVAIGPTSVKVEWDGKEKTFKPIDAAEAKAPSKPGKAVAKAGGPGGERADMVVVQSEARPMPGRDGGRGPGPRGGFDGMRDRFMNMSEAEREKFRAEMQERRERYMNMSEEEREKFRAQMRERFGGRGPGGGEGPGGGRGSGGRRR